MNLQENLKDILKNAQSFLYVGKEVRRIDALEKVLGISKYVSDLYSKDCLVAKVFTSTYPHARILEIDTHPALIIPGVKRIITSKDIPGVNNASYFIPDQPLLAEDKVRYYGEPIGVVVGENYHSVIDAIERIQVKYEPLPAIFDVYEAMKNEVFIHEGGNIAFEKKLINGDVEKGFEESDVIVQNVYETQIQSHAYIETEGALASYDERERLITVIGVQQHPHLARMIISRVLGIDEENITVITPVIGGGFGGKDDAGPWVSALAALAAYYVKKPVFLMYNREESFVISPKRFPFIIKYKSGAANNGKLKAIDVDIVADVGAYSNRGPLVLFRAMLCASGPYEVPNARVIGKLVYTNKVFGGSFRGFGDPEIQFATENNMDFLAEKLGLDPLEFRLLNILKKGSHTAFGQKLEEEVGIEEALRSVAELSDYKRKYREYREFNTKNDKLRRGIGIACIWHGSTITAYRPDGSPRPDWSKVEISIKRNGKVKVHTGLVELGQGTYTAIAQVICELLSLPSFDYVEITSSSNAPDTWATHSSRGTTIGAASIYPATLKLREKLIEAAAKLLACDKEDIIFDRGKIYSKTSPEKALTWENLIEYCHEHGINLSIVEEVWIKPTGSFNAETCRGFIYPILSYAAFITEVEIDLEIGFVRVLHVYPAIACGTIINPVGVKQQICGGFLQGLGLTLLEQVIIKDGIIQNPTFIDYLIPRSEDSPIFHEPVFIEDPHPQGLLGGKGVGEIGTIAAPASITNAISHALGMRINKLPITPEALFFALRQKSEKPFKNKI